jgi:hypothetical protein
LGNERQGYLSDWRQPWCYKLDKNDSKFVHATPGPVQGKGAGVFSWPIQGKLREPNPVFLREGSIVQLHTQIGCFVWAEDHRNSFVDCTNDGSQGLQYKVLLSP